MNEQIIGLLNRRFVCTHFNAHPGPGHDAGASAFVRKLRGLEKVGGVRYGVIATPDGAALASFGYAQSELVAALSKVMKSHSDWMSPTQEERRLLLTSTSVSSQLRAAEVEFELLQDAAARARLTRLLASSDLDPNIRVRVASRLIHYRVASARRTDEPAERLETLGRIRKLGARSAQLVVDRESLDVVLTEGPGFFSGWAYRDGVDLEERVVKLKEWVVEFASAKQVGQLRFYLGLALSKLGKMSEADKVWANHVNVMPEDRYAMLSRIHHSKYQFSPSRKGPGGTAGGVANLADILSDPKLGQTVLDAIRAGTANVQGGDKARILNDLKRQIEQSLKSQKSKSKPEAEKEPTRSETRTREK